MKIAMTISGQPRRYKEGFHELKKWFLDKYDIGYRLPRKFNAEDLAGVIQNINETNYSLKKQECLKCREIEHWEKYESVITNTYKKFLLT